ncbi:hypothetical protein UC8_53130 [Roseimaritima ulvae]|uniref:Uncharacterized protein n=1 Tax=Roseimaritima ulvae TaxID=980254 RepID=A0A5B9R1H0_9BACT|nr:hypothetical protein UC8_53130 [Roseimaritima ulvae]
MSPNHLFSDGLNHETSARGREINSQSMVVSKAFSIPQPANGMPVVSQRAEQLGGPVRSPSNLLGTVVSMDSSGDACLRWVSLR